MLFLRVEKWIFMYLEVVYFQKKKKIKVVPAKVVRAGIKISPKQGFKITNSTFTNKSR